MSSSSETSSALWSHEEFTNRLRNTGVNRYHSLHPFHLQMNAGKLTREQLQGWVANRFYYQKNIPIKDAAIISNCPVREVRRIWLHRISDHDGLHEGQGGIEAWLKLAEACGLTREEVLQEKHVLPGVRFAVDAYVTLARKEPWPVAVASSLTELFAPDLMAQRLAAFPQYYPWVPEWGLAYFKDRVTRAKSDSQEGLKITLEFCNTRELQEAAVRALGTKCDILWAMLDAMAVAYGVDFEKGAGHERK